MSLRSNIVVNTFSQFYGAFIALVMVPAYIGWLGAEAYGLVGFFALLQGWFALLDLGLSPAFSRQVARQRGGAVDPLTLWQLLRALEWIFLAVAVGGSLLLILCADSIAVGWLNAESLPPEELSACLTLMALTLGVRWMVGFYRSVVTGHERLVWLGVVNIVLATLKAVGVLGAFALVGASAATFFLWHLALTAIELALIAGMAYRLMTRVEGPVPWSWRPLREVLRLSLSLAALMALWSLIANCDKVLLSAWLTLSDYATFTVAVLAAGGVTMINGPIAAAVQPRLTHLEAEGDAAGLISLYRRSTQLLVVTAFTSSLVLAFHAEGLLWAWTGDRRLAANGAPILMPYALSFGLLAISSQAYLLQIAKGDLRLHLIGHVILTVVLLPAIVLATLRWGAVGSGWAWLLCQTAYLLAWIPIVHARLAPGLHLQWLMRDVAPSASAAAATTATIGFLAPDPASRLGQALLIVASSLTGLAAAAAASPVLREQLRHLLTARPTVGKSDAKGGRTG